MRFVLALLFFLMQPQGQAAEAPKLTKSKKTFNYDLGDDIEKVLKGYHSFQIFEKQRFAKEIHNIFTNKQGQLPMLSLLDINQDGKKDAVVMGFVRIEKKPFIEVVALVSKGNSYELKPIKRWKLPNLGMQEKKGKIQGQWPYYILQTTDKERRLNGIEGNTQAFKVEAYQSSSLFYFWDGKKFKFIKH